MADKKRPGPSNYEENQRVYRLPGDDSVISDIDVADELKDSESQKEPKQYDVAKPGVGVVLHESGKPSKDNFEALRRVLMNVKLRKNDGR